MSLKGLCNKKFLCMFLAVFLSALLFSGCDKGDEGKADNKDKDEKKEEISHDISFDDEGELEIDGEEFFDCWEYQNSDRWLYVYPDATYEWYNEDGLEYGGTYSMEEDILYLVDDDLRFEVRDGGIVDENNELMFASSLPDQMKEPLGQEVDVFCGTWACESGDMWVEFFEYGEYHTYWNDGFQATGTFTIEDGVLVTRGGARYEYDSEADQLSEDGQFFYRSEIPDDIRNYDWNNE